MNNGQPRNALWRLAAAARAAYVRQKNASDPREWWDERLKGASDAEREYWRANGHYRCRCGTDHRAKDAKWTKFNDTKRVRVCPCCGYMCLTHWEPIDPPPEDGGARVAA